MTSKLVKDVFSVLGYLLAGVLLWGMLYNKGGIVENGYKLTSDSIGLAYQKFTLRQSNELLPSRGSSVVTESEVR